MEMRRLLNIVTESVGDSKLPLDKLAEKYLGPGRRWDDTHYKNILYQVRPLYELFALANRLGEDIVEELVEYDLDEIAKPFTDEMYELIDTNEEIGDQAEYAFSNAYLVNGAKTVVDMYDSPDGNGYWIYQGNDFEILVHPVSFYFEGWYTGNPQSVIKFLTQWRTEFNHDFQTNPDHLE